MSVPAYFFLILCGSLEKCRERNRHLKLKFRLVRLSRTPRVSGVLTCIGRSNLSVLIINCFWVMMQCPHSYLSLTKIGGQCLDQFELRDQHNPPLYLILNMCKETAFCLQFSLNKTDLFAPQKHSRALNSKQLTICKRYTIPEHEEGP